MKYFKTNNVQNAMALSSGIYNLMYPGNTQVESTYLFGWLVSNNPEITEVVLEIDETLECPIFLKSEFSDIIEQLKSLINSNTTQQEIEALISYLQTGTILLINIVPSTSVEVNRDYLIENGYITTNAPY